MLQASDGFTIRARARDQLVQPAEGVGSGVRTGSEEPRHLGAKGEQLATELEDSGSVASAACGDDEQVGVHLARSDPLHDPAAVAHREREAVLGRVVDEVAGAVDQDVVVHVADAVPAEPLHLLADDRRLVEDVAQAEHCGGTAPARQVEPGTQLAGSAVGVPVDDHDVGALLLDERPEDPLALTHRVLEGHRLVAIGAVRRLQQRRHPVDAHALRLLAASGDGP